MAISKYFKKLKVQFELKYWSPGDTVILKDLDFALLYRASFSNGGREPIGRLLSFSKSEACIMLLNKEQWYIDLENIENVTAQARKRKNRIESYMNKEFKTNDSSLVHSIQNDEATITLDLTKLANQELEGIMNVFASTENYEIAETIKKILLIRNQTVTK